MDRHFSSAIIRLTAWYMLIVAIICVGFSFIIYGLSSVEFDRRLPTAPDSDQYQQIDPDTLEQIRAERATASRSHLAASLIVVNAFAFTLGGFGSYFLARRTLRPIQEVTRAQGRFISDASHELRTPLAVMQSEIEISLRGKPGKADLHQLVQSNLEEVNRLRELSDRLLQLSTGGSVALTKVVVEDVVIDGITPHLKKADERKIQIVNKLDSSVAQANAESLKDVVSILIDNAIKYSPNKSKITVRSETRGRNVYIHIADKGRGIEQRDVPFIFDRFYRADMSRTNQDVKGHGLGLSIAKQIVDTMRGDISVKSAPGKGTTFSVKLDVAKK